MSMQGGGFGDLGGRDFVSLGFLITNFSNDRYGGLG